MKTISNIVLFLLISSEFINSQVTQQWVARYNYISEDQETFIAVDYAGNVYVTGRSMASNGRWDYATIKYSPTGMQLWVQRYDGPGNDYDVPNGIVVDDSGNVYVTGTSNQFHSPADDNYDFATIKYNTNGVQQWVRRYDGGGNDASTAGIVIDRQGYIYVGGRKGQYVADYLVIKYNYNGDSLWVRQWDSGPPDNQYDYPAAMAVDLSGNVYMTGAVGGAAPAPDWATVKWNSQGVFQWVRRYDSGGVDYAKAIAVSDSGNIYVTGVVSGQNSGDYATIKYSPSGTQQWVGFYDYGFGDGATSIITDVSENVYVTGQSASSNFNLDYLTIKYNGAGTQLWTARFDGPAHSYDIPRCIKLDDSGNVYVTGYSTVATNNTDYCTIKYNNSGMQKWVIYYNGTENTYDQASSLAVDSFGNIYVTGSSRGIGSNDYATLKYSQTTGVVQISNEIPTEYKLYQNYPNPFNPVTKIKFSLPSDSRLRGNDKVILMVYDVVGKEISTIVSEQLIAGTYEVIFDGSNYPSGVYFYKLATSDYSITKKMVLLR